MRRKRYSAQRSKQLLLIALAANVQKTFIDLFLEGKVLADEIDDFVDAWHKKPSGAPLHEFIGLDKSECALWLRDPDALAGIAKARAFRFPANAL